MVLAERYATARLIHNRYTDISYVVGEDSCFGQLPAVWAL